MERMRRLSACRVVRETVVRLASQHDGTVKSQGSHRYSRAYELLYEGTTPFLIYTYERTCLPEYWIDPIGEDSLGICKEKGTWRRPSPNCRISEDDPGRLQNKFPLRGYRRSLSRLSIKCSPAAFPDVTCSQRYAPQALTQALEGQPLDVAAGATADLDGNGRDSMYRAVRDLAREKVTPLTLGQMYAFGKDPGPEQRLANARFLQRELPVRLSQRAVELMNLPHGLSSMPGIQQVYNCYARYAWEIFCRSAPSSPSEEYDFSCFLSSILLDGQSIPRALSIGLQDFHNRLAEESGVREGMGPRRGSQCLRAMDPAVRLDVQDALSRFFMGRIGVRFLIEHHVASATQKPSRPGWSGVIQSTVSPCLEARHAAADVRSLCMTHLGAVPRIRVLGEDEHTFTYVPSHLEIMLSEQLKNACRAVVEQHHPAYTSMTALAGPIHCWGERECTSVKEQALAAQGWPGGGPQIPPVKVTVTMGKNDVVIKIADEGGGSSRSDIELLWTYFYTTANKHLTGRNTLPLALTGGYEPHDSSEAASGEKFRREGSEQEPVTPLAGLGVGLPLSRVYARYFGGEIILKSMEGFGMDSYLYLNRLAHDCEEIHPLVGHGGTEEGRAQYRPREI